MNELELKDTKEMITSTDYKERFKAEYYQLEIRYGKLNDMLFMWDKGYLKFEPTCPKELYERQLKVMREYLEILAERAEIEKVELN